MEGEEIEEEIERMREERYRKISSYFWLYWVPKGRRDRKNERREKYIEKYVPSSSYIGSLRRGEIERMMEERGV
jgi:DNA topoisomerase VI subunit B